ncbi:MAG: type II secretion system protein GspL [Comamonadaceae bacterium]|nr:general secretion pathway protein GspL [Burkholderiales bacterium]MEB2347014.1 type II secretion system protein GspL [Comamonadaceae bacterium]
MSTLIVTLPVDAATAATELHYVLSPDGHHGERSGSATAALLPDPGRTGETVAIVPQRLLSWQRVTLPQGSLAQTPRLRAILDGLLEEQLLDEPAALHFALQPDASTGTPIWVAACDRAWLREAVQTFDAAGRRIDRIVPAWAPGPTASGQTECTVIGTPEDAQAVFVGLGPEQAVALLPLAASATGAALPEDALVRAEPAVVTLAERALARQVAVQSREDAMLAAARGAWNLAQFDFASNSRRRALRWFTSAAGAFARAPEWRAARWALALLVVAQLGGLNLWAWQDARALQRQEAAVRGALTQTFPQVRLVVDAPAQMQRELARLRQQSGAVAPDDLEPMLAAVAGALPEGRTPARIDYADGQLRLTGLTLEPAERGTLDERLAAARLAMGEEDGALVLHAAGGAQ